MKRFLIIAFSAVLIGHSLSAQEFSFRHLTTADGMLSDLRLVMTEDRMGRLWIGCDEGINVFDGYQLYSYSAPDNSGLLHNSVYRIYCDKQGTIWIATPAGIQYKKEKSSRFIKLETGKDTINGIPSFGETSTGQLVVMATDACYKVDQNFNLSKVKSLEPLFKKYKGPLSFDQFKNDQWFVGFPQKLILIDVNEGKVLNELPFMNAWCASYVTDTTALAGSFVKDSIVLINLRTKKMERINEWPTSDGQKVNGYAASIYPIGNNRYAIGCRLYGVYIADLTNRTVRHLVHDPADPASIKTNFVRRLFITRNGTLFVHARAISYTPLQPPQLSTVKNIVNEKGEKYDGGFNSFVEDKKGNLWISSAGNLALWDREKNISHFYPYYDTANGPQKFRTVRVVVSDSLDRRWVGTFGGGMGLLKPNGSYEQFKKKADDIDHSLPSVDVHSITVDPQQHFIVCCNYGFAYFDPIQKKITTFYNHPVLKSISKKHTYGVLVDKLNNWWLGQPDGIFFYDRTEEKLQKIEMPGEIIDKQVNCFAIDSLGNMYAGGNSGLYFISKNRSVQKWLGKKDGLTSNTVNALVCDKQGIVWIVGNIGMAAYNPVTGQLQVFDANDGLEQTNHPFCSAYMTKAGEIFVASSEGFNYFFPDKVKYKKTPMKVFVTSLELKDTVISSPSLDHVRFRYYQNNFSFTYLVVDFKIAPTIQYRYKLEGFDTAWIYAGKQRTARYTNLPTGKKYSFVVEASTNGKEWFACEQPLSFSIGKAFWKTWWFRVLAISLLVAGGYYYYRNRIRQINKEANLRSNYEIKLNELENSALRTQMNPHFIFNSLNTINSFINNNDRTQANQYISKFSKLVRLILDHSRQKKIALKDELEVAGLYMQLEQIRFQNRFQFEIQLNGMDPNIVEVPPLIIQPFVENAILHGLLPSTKEGKLLVSVIQQSSLLQCTIEDNGIGREAARAIKANAGYQRQSHGLEITMKRIELFNKEYGVNDAVRIIDLKNDGGEAEGTRVEIPLALVETF